MKITKKLALALLASVFALNLSSCSKSDKEETLPQRTDEQFPIKISAAYTGSPNTVVLYEAAYDSNKKLLSLKYYNADSVYNKFTFDASGKVTKIGTTKNPDAYTFEYDSKGYISKTNNSVRGPGGLVVNALTFEHDANGLITKRSKFYAGSTTATTVESFTYDASGNATQQNFTFTSGTATRTFKYSDKLSTLGNSPLKILAHTDLYALTNPVVDFLSKNCVSENNTSSSGDGSYSYAYEFDGDGRVTKVTATDKSTSKVSAVYTVTY